MFDPMRTKMRGEIERRFLNSCLTFVVEFLLPTAAFNAKPPVLKNNRENVVKIE
jgi:hypothetical protein